jgi:hypothetical protein
MKLIRLVARPSIAAVLFVATGTAMAATVGYDSIEHQLDNQLTQSRHHHIDHRSDAYHQVTSISNAKRYRSVKSQMDEQLSLLRPQQFDHRSDAFLQTHPKFF